MPPPRFFHWRHQLIGHIYVLRFGTPIGARDRFAARGSYAAFSANDIRTVLKWRLAWLFLCPACRRSTGGSGGGLTRLPNNVFARVFNPRAFVRLRFL